MNNPCPQHFNPYCDTCQSNKGGGSEAALRTIASLAALARKGGKHALLETIEATALGAIADTHPGQVSA